MYSTHTGLGLLIKFTGTCHIWNSLMPCHREHHGRPGCARRASTLADAARRQVGDAHSEEVLQLVAASRRGRGLTASARGRCGGVGIVPRRVAALARASATARTPRSRARAAVDCGVQSRLRRWGPRRPARGRTRRRLGNIERPQARRRRRRRGRAGRAQRRGRLSLPSRPRETSARSSRWWTSGDAGCRRWALGKPWRARTRHRFGRRLALESSQFASVGGVAAHCSPSVRPGAACCCSSCSYGPWEWWRWPRRSDVTDAAGACGGRGREADVSLWTSDDTNTSHARRQQEAAAE